MYGDLEHPMDRWAQDQLAPEKWEGKSLEKGRNYSWSEATVSSVKHGGGCAMVWACMAAADVTVDKAIH